MKKILLFASAFAGMFLAGSCQRENLEPEQTGQQVTFTIEVPAPVQTKAIADGLNVDELIYEVWITKEPNQKDLEGAERLYQATADMVYDKDNNRMKADIGFEPVNDQNFTILFWAQKKGIDVYDTEWLNAVTYKNLKENAYVANDNRLDAFYAKAYVIDCQTETPTVTLRRPFAQVNLCTTNSKEAEEVEGDYSISLVSSEMRLDAVPTVFNVATSETSKYVVVDFAAHDVPSGDDQKITVNGKQYYYAGMNYVFAGVNTVLTYDIHTKLNGTDEATVNNTIQNVPLKENHRTNIVGNLLTNAAEFDIIVDDEFETPDNIVDEGGSTGGGGSQEPVIDFEITQDGENLTYTVFTPEGLEAWRQAAQQDALDDTDRQVNLILGADIKLEYIEGEANWTPVGTYEHPYDGTIDGAGHYISDMAIDSEGQPAGFIGAWDGEDGGIAAQNLTFRNVHIISSNEYGTGTVVGYGHKKYIIKNCHVKGGSVSGIGGGPCGGLFGGGFGDGFGEGAGGSGKGFGGTAIGCTNSASVITSTITYYVGAIGGFGNAIDCTNTGTVTGSGYYIGGILGGSNGQVTGNKNQGKVTGGVYAGGIVGGIKDGTLENNSNFGDVYGSEEGKLGGIFGWLDESSTTQSGNTYQCIVKVIVVDQDFTVKVEPEVTTYTVYTAEGLEMWRAAAHQNAVDKKSDKVNLLLAADIELPVVEEGSSNWTPLGTTSAPYNGIIDGAGFTISNLTISGGSNVGFIGAASYGGNVVTNLKLDNVNISGAKNVGAVIGQVTNDGKVDNCHVLSGNVTGTGDHVGGILGYSEYYGGVSNSSNEAEVSGASYVGGIAGHAYATKSINKGNVTGTGNYVAGVYAVYALGNRTENQNFGDVTGVDRVAGITANGNSTYSHNEGNITGRDNVAGITCGNGSSYLGNLGTCTNKGGIKGRDYVAGIISVSSNSVADCVNEGVIEGEQYVAGIASSFKSRSGYNNTALARNENKGNVSGKAYVSGIVAIVTGNYNCNITENTNSADITAEDRLAGILAYNENANVVHNTNSGKISGYTNVAYFVGSQNPSYSPDTVTGNVNTGSLDILENNDFTRTVDGTAVSYIVYTQKGFEAWVAEAHKSVEEGFACNLTLETDIELPIPSGEESNWTPIGSESKNYKGNIDGKNHCIYNLTVKESRAGMGFIGYISSGSIKNLNLANVKVIQSVTSNYNCVGGIAGRSAVNIENCHVLSGTIVGLDDWVGGIAGFCSKTITGCTNYASVTGAEKGYYTNGYVGGITGEGNVVSCKNYGAVLGYNKYTGGCTGRGNATDCQNFASVTKGEKGTDTGGITGSGKAENCSNSGNVTGYESVGGISGNGDAVNCENSGTVTGSSKSVGGIVGYFHGTSHKVVECINSGVVSGTTQVGGIIGYASMGSVTDCKNSAKVSATGNKVGGIVGSYSGYSNQSLSGCENSGDVYSDGSYVGGIAGETSDNNCVLTTSINRGNVTGKDYVGGIAGNAITVTDCHNSGNVSGNQSVGGIAGSKVTASKPISGSENKGAVTGVSYLGGIVGFADAGTVTDNTHSGKVSGQDKVGGIVGYNEEAIVTYNTHAGAAEALTNVAAIVAYQDPSFSPDIVTGNVDNGTETSLAPTDYTREVNGSNIYYKVYTASGLLTWMQEAAEGASSNSKIVHLELMADVTLPADAVWTPIGRNYYNYTSYSYKGNVDGHGHTISNLTINAETNQAGFIGSLAIGTVKNLKFANVNVSSTTSYTGVVVGYNRSGTIENCHVLSGTISSTNTYTGGIVGYGPTDAVSVTNCTNAAVISSTSSDVGGIAGRSDVDNCKNTAQVSGTSHVGGITGFGDVNDSENSASVTGTREYVGGITAEGNVARSKNFGDVATANTRDRVGGITAYGDVTDSDNTGNVSGKNNLGGITGQGGAINCTNTGDVTSHGNQSKTGGISGYSKKDISNCTNTGNVSGQHDMGGIVGYIEGGKVSSCENSGSVTGWQDTGGIAGYSSVDVEQCTNRGKVVSTSSYVGGIVGRSTNGSTISGCKNYADVTSTSSSGFTKSHINIGGIAGYAGGEAAVLANYNEGNVYGYNQIGGIVGGIDAGTLSNNENKGDVSHKLNTYVGLIAGKIGSSTVTDDNIAGGQLIQIQ